MMGMLLMSKCLRNESLWQNRLLFSLLACETEEVQSNKMVLSRGHSTVKLLKITCIRRDTFEYVLNEMDEMGEH